MCFWDVRATKLLLGATWLIMPTCPFVPNQITQKVLNAVLRHTHSMTWNINRHRLRQELKRARRSWQSRTVSGGCVSADAGRDCTISTPAMNDTRIKVEYVHDEKESDHGAIFIRDRTPLQSKTKKNLHLKLHRLRLSQRTADDTILKHAHLVMVHIRGGEPLVASSAKNLLGDSTYLRLDVDETRPAELCSGYPADRRREARPQCFKSQKKPALSFCTAQHWRCTASTKELH